MKKILKSRIFLVLITAIVVTSVSVYATTTIIENGESVIYDNTESGINATNIQDAIDELYGKVSSGGATNRNWSMQCGFSGTAVQYTLTFNNNTFDIRSSTNATMETYTFPDGAVRTTQPTSSPYPVTYTYLKDGYYNINGTWTYKSANSTSVQNYYDFVFWYEDLKIN